MRAPSHDAISSEARLDGGAEAPLLARVETSRKIGANESVEEGEAGTHAAHRAAHVADLSAIADPAQITKQRRTNARAVRPDLGAPEPVRVAALGGIGL